MGNLSIRKLVTTWVAQTQSTHAIRKIFETITPKFETNLLLCFTASKSLDFASKTLQVLLEILDLIGIEYKETTRKITPKLWIINYILSFFRKYGRITRPQ